jgi:outer membrane protein assembly factor BamB
MRFSGTLLHEGVVYCADSLGFIGAVEAASGRVLWVRRIPATSLMPGMGVEQLRPWQYGSLIASGGSVYALAPDRSGLLQLDAATGNVRARRSSSALGEPLYLLRVGERFGAVGNDSIVFGGLGAVAEGPVHRSSRFAEGIRGRVVVAGESLVVPVVGGVAVIESSEPAKHRVERLSEMGNVLPLESQLLAIDGRRLHSYLTWNMAHDLLDRRMRADPGDAEPAITYAELAYRAGRHEGIAPAADRALAALEQRAAGEESRSARRRLFTVLKEMVETTQAAWEPVATAPAPAARPGESPQARSAEPERPRLSLADLGAVVQRLGRAAQDSNDRVAYYLALGRLREAENSPAQAAEAYQRILAEPPLQAATWRGPRASVRGELEASRRVRQLLADFGAPAYAAFEAQASEELGMLGAGAGAEALESLARRYPAAGASARAWSRAAEQHRQARRPRSEIAALREGLAVAEVATGAGSLRDPELLGRLAGNLVVALERGEQYYAAAQLLTKMKAKYPQLALVGPAGTPVAESGQELSRRLAQVERLPRIGTQLQPQVQVIAGWGVMAPRSRGRAGAASEHVILGSPSEQKVALWSAAPAGEGTGMGRTQLHQVWARAYEGRAPTVLRQDPDVVYLLWPARESRQGPSLEAINALDGATIYRSPDLRTLFASDTNLERQIELLRNTIDTPLDGAVSMGAVLTALDGDVVVLVERTGRAAAFERGTGKLLWARATPVNQVHDIALAGGVLAVGGEATPESDPYALVGLVPAISLLDARTGEVVHRLAEVNGQVRWLRIGQGANEQAVLIAGLAAEVTSIDLTSGAVNWAATGGAAFGSSDAWVFGDRIFLLDENRALFLIDAATGRLPQQPLNTEDRLFGMGPIEGTRVGRDRFAFASERGLCIFDRAGTLVGLDPLQDETGETTILTPAPTQGSFVAVENTPRHRAEERLTYTLHIMDNESGMLRSSRALRLELPPRRLAVMDGRIVLTAGNITLVYEAPERDP